MHHPFSRTFIFIASIAALCSSPLHAQNPGDSIFFGIKVHTIDLRFAQPSFWDSLTFHYDQGVETYILARATIDGVAYDSIGVRLKGNSSYTHPNNKKSIRLSLDEFKGSNKWDGEKSLHLNNCWGDPTFMREKLYFDFCRDAGIASPRSNFARVTLNDSLWGLYSLVEHVDKRFLKTQFGDPDGDLFKAVDGFEAVGQGAKEISDFKWYGAIDTAYMRRYELKTNDSGAWKKLIAFIDTLNQTADVASWLPTKMDAASFLNAMAADNLLANLDSYAGSGRNFYFYSVPKIKTWRWIPWDGGLCFGVFSGAVATPEALPITYVVNPTERPLYGKVLSSATMRNEYLNALCLILTKYFSSARLAPKIDSIANIIRPFVNEDQRKMYTLKQFETNIVSEVTASGGGGTRKPGLKSFITARATNVRAHLTALGVQCVVSVDDAPIAAPSELYLEPAFPAPFTSTAIIPYRLSAQSNLRIEVQNALGQRIAVLYDGAQAAGVHTVSFDASALPSGAYLCSFRSATAIKTIRLTHVR